MQSIIYQTGHILIYAPHTRGDQQYPQRQLRWHAISIHVPRVRDDLAATEKYYYKPEISIHVPRMRDDTVATEDRACHVISIHVPRMRDDRTTSNAPVSAILFQSTSLA